MSLTSLLLPVLVAVGLTVAALGLRGRLLKQLARRGETEAGQLAHLRLPSLLWCGVLGLYGGMVTAPLPPRLVQPLQLLLQVLIVGSVTVTAANLLATALASLGERRTPSIAVTGLAQTAVRVAVLVVGGLILLGTLGVAITPILTALGIGGLAVALALQDVLSNLFAGIHLLADRFIRVGDFVKLESGVEGFVDDIGWRSTRIRLPHDAMVVVPNAKLAQSAVTRLSPPPDSVVRERETALPAGFYRRR